MSPKELKLANCVKSGMVLAANYSTGISFNVFT